MEEGRNIEKYKPLHVTNHFYGSDTMSCEYCKDIVDRSDVPHLLRTCENCGRELRYVRYGKYGKGIRVEEGEQLVIPKEWLKLSLNPLKGHGQFTIGGLDWFVELIFVDGLPGKDSDYAQAEISLEQLMDAIVNKSSLIAPLDINNAEDVEKITEILTGNRQTQEYWAFLTGMFLSIAREARSKGDSERASWATACAERCRTMVVFKEHLQEVVWMGHSAKRIIEVLRTWDSRRTEGSEEFWQLTFNEHSYVLSQVFAVPVIFLHEKAYIGGMKVDRQEAKFVDYLFSAESSREAILVEIKTPVTRLLGRQYRKNIFAPSVELAGAVVQILSYRTELLRNLKEIFGSGVDIQAFQPKCVLIAGNTSAELIDEHRRKSFELFRSALDVEIVTYDELFRKVEILAELFALHRVRLKEI